MACLTGQYRLGPTIPILKHLAQQGGRFVIVDRGHAMIGF